MNDFFKSRLGKCFLYTLLYICIFLTLILFGCFISGNTNIMEWQEIGRFLITLISLAVTSGIVIYKEVL